MIETARTIDAPPQAVWDVLADGWLYPLWVVGATRMRGVDGHWPDRGARIHHSAGSWPLVLDDHTEVLACEPLKRIELRAKGWPLGVAKVSIELEEVGAGTHVRLTEDASEGPGRFVPYPVRAPLMRWRNTESLRRLAFVVEGRTR